MVRMGVLGAALAIFVASSSLAAQPVDDGTRAAARSLGQDGVVAYNSGDFALAAVKLDKAYQILRVPTLGLWSARAFTKVGKLLEASERYREVLRLVPSEGDLAMQKQAQTDAASELEAIQPKLPSIVVVLEGAVASEVSVTLDGGPLSSALIDERRPVNPGKHEVIVRRGDETVSLSVVVREGERKTALLRFGAPAAEPEPAAPQDQARSTRRTLGWVALGAGGVGLAVGTVTAILAMNKRAEIDDLPGCTPDACPVSEKDEVDALNSLRTTSTVAFVTGGVLAGAGLVLVLTSRSAEGPSASAFVGPGSVGVRGRF